MLKQQKLRSAQYMGLIVVNVFALVLAALLDPHSQLGTYFCLMAAVMMTAWLGGRLAGLFAVALATWVGNYPLLAGHGTGDSFAEDFLRLTGLVVACLLVSGVTSLRSQQWEADRKLKDLEKRLVWLDAMLASHPTPLLLFRPAEGVFYANRAARGLAGGTSPLGPLPGDAESAEQPGAVAPGVELCERALRGEAIDREIVKWEAVGRSRYLSVSARRIAPLSGEPEACVFSYEDVSELQDLANQRAELVSSVSHSLRAPLTATLLNLEVLMDGTSGELRPGQARYLESSYRQVEDLSRLVTELLALSKLDHGEIEIRSLPVEIESLLRDVVSSLAARAEKREIQITCKPELGNPHVISDSRHLTVVLTELIENAIKYSPHGSFVRISVSDHPDEVSIQVCDEGPGIGAGESEAVFNAFHRGEAAANCVEPGTGLGLGIARKTMRLLGGDVAFVPHAGVGTIVRVTVPRVVKLPRA